MNQLMKRVLSVLLVVCLLCSALPSAFAAEGGGFTDVSKDHWAYDAITEAVAAGYFKGVSDTAFDPEGTLILTMLYRLCPTLIREGYVYIAETPLFEITCKEKSGEKTWFAYSEKEKADILKKLEGKKVNVQRSKGLGENDPEMMWMTTMSPETRRLIRVLPEDAEETARVFDLLLGDNLAGRKDYIAENGYKYLDMIDVS